LGQRVRREKWDRQDCEENLAREAFKETLDLVGSPGLRALSERLGRGANLGHPVPTD